LFLKSDRFPLANLSQVGSGLFVFQGSFEMQSSFLDCIEQVSVPKRAMQPRLTWQTCERLSRAFWDKYPTLQYRRDFLRFTDWFTVVPNELPIPICRTLVRGWLAHLLTEQGIVATASNLCRVLKWVKSTGGNR